MLGFTHRVSHSIPCPSSTPSSFPPPSRSHASAACPSPACDCITPPRKSVLSCPCSCPRSSSTTLFTGLSTSNSSHAYAAPWRSSSLPYLSPSSTSLHRHRTIRPHSHHTQTHIKTHLFLVLSMARFISLCIVLMCACLCRAQDAGVISIDEIETFGGLPSAVSFTVDMPSFVAGDRVAFMANPGSGGCLTAHCTSEACVFWARIRLNGLLLPCLFTLIKSRAISTLSLSHSLCQSSHPSDPMHPFSVQSFANGF